MSSELGDCGFGDITVTPAHDGYLVSRVLQRPAYGPWWEFIAKVPARGEALERACTLARVAESTAWVYEQGLFREISENDLRTRATTPEQPPTVN